MLQQVASFDNFVDKDERFSDVTACRSGDHYPRLGEAFCLLRQETYEVNDQSTLCHIPEDFNLHVVHIFTTSLKGYLA